VRTTSKQFVWIAVAALLLALVPLAPAAARDFLGIIDYRPSSFVEQPAAPFFYSIGNKLRFGRAVEDSGPILFEAPKSARGGIWAVLVAPDQTRAIVVSDAKLFLVRAGSRPIELLDRAYDLMAWGTDEWMKGPPNQAVYIYRQLQWDQSSRFVYIPRGAWKNRYPSHSALVRINVSAPSEITEITSDASGIHMFFVGRAVCFQRVVNHGDLVWRCSVDGMEKIPVKLENDRIVMDGGTAIEGKPFNSYFDNLSELWLPKAGFSIRAHNGHWGFFSRHRSEPAFEFTGVVEPLKGNYFDGINQAGCVLLPGDRYAVLDVTMDNFNGRAQLLLDGMTGQYRPLPKGTRVHMNLNSFTYDHVSFGLRPLDSPEFKPMAALRAHRY
jgi:hypothetical protein